MSCTLLTHQIGLISFPISWLPKRQDHSNFHSLNIPSFEEKLDTDHCRILPQLVKVVLPSHGVLALLPEMDLKADNR